MYVHRNSLNRFRFFFKVDYS